jgi:hypothetical protein
MVNPEDLERAIKLLKVALARLDGATFSYSTTVGEKSGDFDKVRGEIYQALKLLRAECEHNWIYSNIGMYVNLLE